MEFSFDRSNDAQSQQGLDRAISPDEGVDPSTIANERLRKAIERNRARQAERNRNQPSPNIPPSNPRAETQQQASFFDRQPAQVVEQAPVQEKQAEVLRETAPPRPRVQERVQAASEVRSNTVITRRSVARPDEADFAPAKRAPRKVASQISYTTTTGRKKSKPLDPAITGYLLKGCWIFCVIMILRLIFASGGVTDYYSRRSVFSDRLHELDRIKKENMQLVHEIERMQSDSSFQKKLVRDNLGFIASDEFLVLFPKEKSIQ